MKRLPLLALLLFAACTRQDVENAGNSIASAAPQFASDGVVVARVEARFVQLDADSALHVAVSSRDGVVRVSGKVKNAVIAARYVAAARAIPGVKRVNDSLVVDPHLPRAQQDVSDFALAVAVRAALVGQGGVNAISLDIRAHAGAVVLSGKVRTPALRATLLAAAKATRGVRSVVDHLEIGS